MAKYYVQSGGESMVVSAQDAEGAALFFLHHHLKSVWDNLEQLEFALIGFDYEIVVSERCMGKSEAGRFSLVEIRDCVIGLLHAASEL